ncbi:MAG: endonuclease/exonuclease/phosphatase family protein [Rhodothermales bacterium]
MPRNRASRPAPYLAELASPLSAEAPPSLGPRLRVATYNVHRWAGVRGGRKYEPEPVLTVLGELDADVIALQEVLRPWDNGDPLREASQRLGFHLAFVVTRIHKRGALGNAILSRWPLAHAEAIDLSFGRLERRAALAVRLTDADGTPPLSVASTHLAIVDRTRTRQVEALLDHPHFNDGPSVLLGDMNAWRKNPASRNLQGFAERHHNRAWPPSYPSVRPVLALDRVYARGVHVEDLHAHESAASRQASDHLPVVGTVVLDDY